MKRYYVNAIVQEKDDVRAWLLPILDGAFSLEEAMKQLEFMRSIYTVLCAWADCFDEKDQKSVVFHECYVDPFGWVRG